MPRLGDPEKTLYLIDISSFIFRAFFAIRHLSNSKGIPTNAVYGVVQMIHKLIEDAKPKHLKVVYDSKEPSFRHEMYDEYKANRSEAPDDLVPQFDLIEEVIEAFGIPSVRQPGFEADDLIASLARKWVKGSKDRECIIVSGDKDLMQLVNGRIRMWDTMKNKVFGSPEVVEKFGVEPKQMRDYLALVGDSSDNVPGVRSIGPKSAVTLLGDFKDLKGVLKAAKGGKIKGKKGEVLQELEDDALLSYDLVGLREDLKVDMKSDYAFKISPELIDCLRDLEFNTLVAKWSQEIKTETPTAVVTGGEAGEFKTIDTEKDLNKALEAITRRGEFCVDLETTSLNPREAEIVGWALCYDTKFGGYVPVGHRVGNNLKPGLVLDKLKPILEDPRIKKVGQNLKYDWSVLREQGVRMDGIGADTMIAAYLIDPSGRHGFDLLVNKYLGYTAMKYEEVCGKGKDQIGFDQVPIDQATRYAAEDALYTQRLWETLYPQLSKHHLLEVFATLELPLITILGEMEATGVSIDEKYFKGLSKEFSQDILKIQQKINAFTAEPVNLNSPKQLAHLLFEELGLPTQTKKKTGYSTDAKVLEALKDMHEVPKLLLEYREIAKLLGTYVDPLPKMVDPKDKRIHASFHQTVAATGRLSSSDPNLQNIPARTDRGIRIRKGFVPGKGKAFLSADYSQIELRILAHMSGDPDLVESFNKDQDIHRRTAAEIFEVSQKAVTDRQRGMAKAINFGLMYGKTPFGLAQELKISRGEAKDIIERYFKRYKNVKDLLDGLVDKAHKEGVVHTLFGRRRELPDIKSKNPAIRNNAERMAMNTPIQGTAADLMKLAMIRTDEALSKSGLESKMVIQVHDELVLECPKEELKEAQALLVKSMEEAHQFKVPLKVNAESGKNWMEL